MSEYVEEIFNYLNVLEKKYAIRENHLDGQRDVFPKMRAVLIDWINEVHQQYRFTQETFHMAVSLIDRYLQVRRIFQHDQPPCYRLASHGGESSPHHRII